MSRRLAHAAARSAGRDHAEAVRDPGPPFHPDLPRRGAWLVVLRRYVGFIAVANLIWEVAQLPLYTIWSEGTAGEIVFAVAHCTTGDVIIASLSLLAALLLAGTRAWPLERYWRVAFLAFVFGLGYTILSEWLNTEVRGSWAYAESMPVLPLIGAGVAPVAQWLVLPLAGLWWARRPVVRNPHPARIR